MRVNLLDNGHYLPRTFKEPNVAPSEKYRIGIAAIVKPLRGRLDQ